MARARFRESGNAFPWYVTSRARVGGESSETDGGPNPSSRRSERGRDVFVATGSKIGRCVFVTTAGVTMGEGAKMGETFT